MAKQTQGPQTRIGVIVGGIFVVAFLALMILGNYGFFGAFFLAAIIAAAVGAFLYVSGQRESDEAAQAPPAVTEAPRADPTPAAAETSSRTPDDGSNADAVDTAPAAVADAAPAPSAASADDLKVLSGVGPALERKLHENGVTTLAQIAAWSEADIADMDDKLAFKGRIQRDGWVEQARKLTSGES